MAYVESSEMAKALYEKYGWMEVGYFELDMAYWSKGQEQGSYRETFMIREARRGVQQIANTHRRRFSFQRVE